MFKSKTIWFGICVFVLGWMHQYFGSDFPPEFREFELFVISTGIVWLRAKTICALEDK